MIFYAVYLINNKGKKCNKSIASPTISECMENLQSILISTHKKGFQTQNRISALSVTSQ